MNIHQFDYDLPARAIAQYPAARRSDARLLYLESDVGAFRDLRFKQLPELLEPGDLVVLNDTRVLAARFYGRKDSGGRVEVMLERVESPRVALARVRAGKAPAAGRVLRLECGAALIVEGREQEFFRVRLSDEDMDFQQLTEQHGATPLPPYIRRAPRAADRARYQTVYARHAGAVAAPTAGLHFDEPLLAALAARGIERCFITLHVGAGTFQPLRGDDIDSHTMHPERVMIAPEACDAINRARRAGRRIVAIGTTVVRALESAAAHAVDGAADDTRELAPYHASTRLFIRPGFRFRVVDVLVTNFHLPRSTLLMLVCAFGGGARVMAAYQHALRHDYRFYSYGDAMLLASRTGTGTETGGGDAL